MSSFKNGDKVMCSPKGAIRKRNKGPHRKGWKYGIMKDDNFVVVIKQCKLPSPCSVRASYKKGKWSAALSSEPVQRIYALTDLSKTINKIDKLQLAITTELEILRELRTDLINSNTITMGK